MSDKHTLEQHAVGLRALMLKSKGKEKELLADQLNKLNLKISQMGKKESTTLAAEVSKQVDEISG